MNGVLYPFMTRVHKTRMEPFSASSLQAIEIPALFPYSGSAKDTGNQRGFALGGEKNDQKLPCYNSVSGINFFDGSLQPAHGNGPCR